jgi:hypothetical protein
MKLLLLAVPLIIDDGILTRPMFILAGGGVIIIIDPKATIMIVPLRAPNQQQ